MTFPSGLGAVLAIVVLVVGVLMVLSVVPLTAVTVGASLALLAAARLC